MEFKKIILIIIVLFVLVGCDEDPKYKTHPSGKFFCERFLEEFPDCSCSESNLVYKSGRTSDNTQDAEAYFGKYYFENVLLPNDIEYNPDKLGCQIKGSGFFDCHYGDYAVVVSDYGEIFKTKC